MSLDGFIAGPGDDVQQMMAHVFAWYSGGDTEYQMPSGRMPLRVAREDAEVLRELHASTGALVQGRTTFDLAQGWGGRHPMTSRCLS